MKKILLGIVLLSGCITEGEKMQVKSDASANRLAALTPEQLLHMPELQKTYEAVEVFFRNVLIPAGFNGGILVAQKGHIVFEHYFGKEKLHKGDAIDSSSAIHLASVSKTFTAMAILKLWEDGVLDIDDPVAHYLPEFPYPDVRIRDMLNHRSGIPNYVHFMESLGWKTDSMLTNQGLLEFIKTNQSKIGVLKPNRRFEYSNTNYAMLALVIEAVSRQTYSDYLKSTFFRPLGMNNTFVFSMDKADYAIPSYDHRGREEPYTFLDAVYGDKNIYSTPRDLFRWDRALTEGNLFQQKTLDEAYAGYSYEKRGIKNYGLGWRLYEFPHGKKIIYHNGWWHGNNTVFGRLPQDSATVIVLGNRFTRKIYQAQKLYSFFDTSASDAEMED